MSERSKYLLCLAIFVSLLALTSWYFYPMSDWGRVEWLLAIWLIPGTAILIGLVVSIRVASIISERKLNKVLKKAQEETKTLIAEIRAKKK